MTGWRLETILFETHATSTDNEAGIASGHADVDLSPRGVDQAGELGRRYRERPLDLVLTSDLRRAWRTAELAFGDRVPIMRDPRLRECDYGRQTSSPREVIEAARARAVGEPFPGGESYVACTERFRRCIVELATGHETVLVIGHRATQYSLESLVHGTPLDQVVVAPWSWQPGWTYVITPEARARFRWTSAAGCST